MSLNIQKDVLLAPLTTFKIGGFARYFVDVKTEEEIRAALAHARECGLRFVILAGGSNVLVPDEGLDALVIRVRAGDFSFSDNELTASAGCSLLTLIRSAGELGLGGWEKLAGIPGTVGGAVRGNAGAFGPEIKDFTVSTRALHAENGECRDFVNPYMKFAYRTSFFKQNSEWIILHTRLKLFAVDSKESKRLIEETIAEREKRHIQNVRAAGSFFVNPVVPLEVQEMFEQEKSVKSREGRVPAGWFIEKVGLRGARVGDAVASDQHPNYIKNDGAASAKDVLALAQKIKDAVQKQFGVELKEEAVIL